MCLNKYKLLIIRLFAQLFAACTLSDRAEDAEAWLPLEMEVDLAAFFPGIDPNDASFVVFNPLSGQIIRHNAERAQQRFIPASTYKIPNSLIALETAVAKGAEHMISWMPRKPTTRLDWPSLARAGSGPLDLVTIPTVQRL